MGELIEPCRVRTADHQLRHAQKMENVGMLAGGIARDFNNMLCGVMGSAELIQQKLLAGDADPEVLDYARNIAESGRLAGELTAQLLTFSRKGIVRSEPVDLSPAKRTSRTAQTSNPGNSSG